MLRITFHPGAPPFSFRGFFSPVDNDPVVNKLKAGAAVPVKFSLGGDRGLNIFQGGFPASQPVACDNFATLASVEETISAGQSGLTYDASIHQSTLCLENTEILGEYLPTVSASTGGPIVPHRRFQVQMNADQVVVGDDDVAHDGHRRRAPSESGNALISSGSTTATTTR